MNIPLDRLYNYISSITENAYGEFVLIYRFFPHGSKNIDNLKQLSPPPVGSKLFDIPEIFCNDQEPLNYQLYEGHSRETSQFRKILKENNMELPRFNMRGEVQNKWDHAVIIHSEQRSDQVELYQQCNFIPVYYWSHAIIARDWFRYAQHVDQKKQMNKTFLIYNRAWAGTREYRLRFAELLVHQNLQNLCKTSINTVEPELGVHYETHKFDNPLWQPSTVLENYFPINTVPSHYSADFDIEDYEATDIEVVLETLFNDNRLHLTEKSLRPIACAQPFILAGTHGSLEYLRSYGFKTFADVWDESYDLVEDPYKRLESITNLMRQISYWSPETQERKMIEAQTIANYNKQHFFSQKFFNLITNELKTNLKEAFIQLSVLNTEKYWKQRNRYTSSIRSKNFFQSILK